MTWLVELLAAFLILTGLFALYGWTLGRLLDPVGRPGAPVCLLIRGEGAGEGLEYTVHALHALRRGPLALCPVLLVDAGLDEEGRALAQLLVRRWPELRLCRARDVETYIT